MAELEPTDWAYAAGFVDGEGCIAVVRSWWSEGSPGAPHSNL